MAIEIVDFPIKNGDFPWQNASSPEGILNDQEECGHVQETPTRKMVNAYQIR